MKNRPLTNSAPIVGAMNAVAVNVRDRAMVLVCLSMALLLSLVGCGPSITEVMDSWLGSSRHDLLASWGPPTTILEGENGGEVWVYQRNVSYVVPGRSTTTTNATASGPKYGDSFGNPDSVSGTSTSTTVTTPPRTVTYQQTRTFWIDSRGIIYRWSSRG